eukprot:Skav210601  [mRNA]  locus=scaffold234:26058:30767:- [translate_table: standard]
MAFRSNRILRTSLGAPAALRAGSTVAGTWTGVLSFGDSPLRQVPCHWPSGEFASGRVLITVGFVKSVAVTAATVYCPPRGPTYPNAKELSEALLRPVTAEVVYGRQGPRAILGDFNCPPGQLDQMKVWASQGWIELQDLMHQRFGVSPRPTCKKATAPDQIWLSPELAMYVTNVALWDIYPDHSMLIAGLQMPADSSISRQWPLPGHVPWDQVNNESWIDAVDFGPVIEENFRLVGSRGSDQESFHDSESSATPSSTEAFRRWSQRFERSVSQHFVTPVSRHDRSYHGRGRLVKPIQRPVAAPVVRHSRQGELQQACGFLNRACAHWFKQLRRLQSYRHAAVSHRSQENIMSRVDLWNCILRAPGFVGGFATWWTKRPFQQQGVPSVLPQSPPGADLAVALLEDFASNYRRFEHYQWRRRHESCQSKLLSTTRGLFAATRKPAKSAIDCLEEVHERKIHVEDTRHNLVSVSPPFPVLLCPVELVERILQHAFQRRQAMTLAQRVGFAGLEDGCDVALTLSSDRGYGMQDQARLMIVRDGSFITDSAKAHYDARRTANCYRCGVPDTRDHKYAHCEKYRDLREQSADIVAEWDMLPPCFRLHGLVPANPWTILLWEAFIALPSGIDDHRFPPTGDVLHCFTDGTVADPASQEDSLAAWSVVIADHGPLSWGPLPGIQQTVPRAEAFAIWSVLRWARAFAGTLHLWIDNQGAVDHIRDVLRGVFLLQDVANRDIWGPIEDLLRASAAEIIVHKVDSHLTEDECQSPMADFARTWNSCADRQAASANLTRPRWFMRLRQRHQAFRQLWRRRVGQITQYQVAIASRDCNSVEEPREEPEPEVSQLEFVWELNTASVSVQLGDSPCCDDFFGSKHDFHFRNVTAQFVTWLHDVDAAASHMRIVSMIELYIGFRLSLCGRPPLVGGDVSAYVAVTFAADFRYFKSICRLVASKVHIPIGETVSLVPLHVILPQQGFWVGWPTDVHESVLHALQSFVGSRPITGSQSLARPWQP